MKKTEQASIAGVGFPLGGEAFAIPDGRLSRQRTFYDNNPIRRRSSPDTLNNHR